MLRTVLVVGAAALVVATLAFGLLSDGDQDEPRDVTANAPISGDSAVAIGLLREELDIASMERRALAARVAQLEELRALSVRPGELPAPTPEDPPPADVSARSSVSPTFPEEALLAAGFARVEVQAYRERVDRIELDRLYLRDRAAREGWRDTPRYDRESGALFQALLDTREEFGDELYDWTLFSSGHPNRVKVAEVMDGSPASLAGIEAGDLLVRYGERQIFSPMELREQTLEGSAGEATAMEIVRQGETRRIFIPRGPLGIRTNMVVREPAG